MNRRKFLIGITGSQITTAGCATVDAPARKAEQSRTWEDEADERIAKHRTTELEIAVTDQSDAPVTDAAVAVAMRSHRFGFGTAVDAKRLVESGEGGPYRTHLRELFNKAVLENRHKWGFWERNVDRRYATEATDWLLDQGLEMRGHTCIWQRFNQGAIPADVVDAVESGNGQYISRRARAHIGAIIEHYRGTNGLTEWDVVNEPSTYHALTDAINGKDSAPTPPELLAWYRRARRADGDARLFVNEFNVLPGNETKQRATYERIIRYLLDNDAPLGGIGLQAHFASVADRRSPTELLATFDRFASFGVPLQVTEYDNWGPNWTDELEAEHLYKFLKTTFSHPAVEGFLMWGFWNGAHWKGNAPLFREDWSTKPAYHRYRELVFDEWWTDTRGVTDADGRYRTTAFLGDHDVSVHKDGENASVTAAVTDPTTPTSIEIRLS